jgi:hypothetical protein
VGRLIGMLTTFLVYFCVATVITLCLLLGYASSKGYLDKDKVTKMIAVAQGTDESPVPGTEANPLEPGRSSEQSKLVETSEQPSLEDIETRRAVQFRNLELREQALDTGLQQIRSEQRKLADDKDGYDRLKSSFDKQLAELKNGSQATGRENIRLIWENIKPKQAKDQILQMIQAGQKEDVVAILSAMAIGKQSKIIGEFKTDDEPKKLQEILDLIRQGMPEQKVVDNAQQQLNQVKQ